MISMWRGRMALAILIMAAALHPFAVAQSETAQAPNMGVIRLESAGAIRRLPPGIAGASSEPLIERLIGNSAKTSALKAIAPAILRFPGGSQSNFYD